MSKVRLTACLFVIMLSLIPRASVFALEMSPERDCAVCHIMWLPDFRTSKETLVEFQPGNVLMKDTQGIVSSEDICYSCHDGYVQDSRAKVWDNKRHPVFVKPSNDVTVPPDLPLSVKDEIYCGTCHSAHGEGAAPHGDPMGRTKVFRETNINSGLCEKCHRNEAAYRSSNGHPLHISEMTLPESLFAAGAKKATGRNMIICQSCHAVHGAKGEHIVIIDNRNSALCLTCHEKQSTLLDTKHDLQVTLPGSRNIKQQTLSESGPCGACHTPHNAAGRKLWARSLKPGNPASRMCLSCHGEETPYQIKRIGDYSHPVDVALSSNEAQSDKLPLFFNDGTRSDKGKVQCFTCHDVHRWDPDAVNNKGGKDAEGDSTNSFLRVSGFSSFLCVACHKDKEQVITSDHNLEMTAPGEKNIQGFTPAVSGPCGACHIPHNAVSRRLWAKELSPDKDFVMQLCSACHNKDGAARAKLAGGINHPMNITAENLPVSVTLPLYEKDGDKTDNGRIVCLTCHEPHTWDLKVLDRENRRKNMEGDASNSFLRRSNAPVSVLCETCHADKGLIDGTDHDLNVTALHAKNLLGQTVRESGVCGACHLVHNGTNDIRLWARPYGPPSADREVIEELCTCCHSQGNIAADKIPSIATHPENIYVNNIMRSDKRAIDYAPLYDRKTGKETHVGNISCPTCHNAHQWSPVIKEKGNYKNREGNATNSFLRNVSYNNICIDCHGLDALFRFKYFHSPEERVE